MAMSSQPRRSFHEQLEALTRAIFDMGTLVEDRVRQAVQALKTLDFTLAHQIVEGDTEVNQLEVDIEQQCLQLLALQQPMASDLRTISTALKLVTDLERIGDHAKDIARVTLRLQGQTLLKPLIDIPRMAELACRMIRQGLSAYADRDAELARETIILDSQVDVLYQQVFRELLTYMIEDPRHIGQGTQLLFVGSHLERVADHATNLNEWVIFMVTGQHYQDRAE